MNKLLDDRINLEFLKNLARTGKIKVCPEFWTDKEVQQEYLSGTFIKPTPGQINPLHEIREGEYE